jgi:hypothetical protein
MVSRHSRYFFDLEEPDASDNYADHFGTPLPGDDAALDQFRSEMPVQLGSSRLGLRSFRLSAQDRILMMMSLETWAKLSSPPAKSCTTANPHS